MSRGETRRRAASRGVSSRGASPLAGRLAASRRESVRVNDCCALSLAIVIGHIARKPLAAAAQASVGRGTISLDLSQRPHGLVRVERGKMSAAPRSIGDKNADRVAVYFERRFDIQERLGRRLRGHKKPMILVVNEGSLSIGECGQWRVAGGTVSLG